MPESNVELFVENAGKNMTVDEGLALVARSRRQIDRFAAQQAEIGMRIIPEYEAELRAKIDDLEASLIAKKPGC